MTGPDLVAFDLETTGLSAKADRIIEVGAVRFDHSGAVASRLDLVVDPGMPVPLTVQRLTGLGDADLAGAPSPEEAVAQLADFCEGTTLVAHGGQFDLAFCAAILPGAFSGRPVVDTLELARILLPTAPSHSLPLLAAALGLAHERPHRAPSDADATRLLLVHLLGVAEALPASLLARMRSLVAGLRLPLATFLLDLVEGGGSAVAAVSPALAAPVPTAAAVTPAGGAAPPVSAPGPVAEAAARALGPGGPFAEVQGYELREAQVEMARAVGQALDRRRRLLVEAGTGVGKSLAYSVPLALWTAAGGGRAVVATHTITLQEQLAMRDLPFVLERLGLPVRHAMLKGRQHYVSLRRWARFLDTPDHGGGGLDLERLRFKLKLLCWLAQTTTGDRAELRLSGSEEPFWRLVQSDTDDCLGSVCANWRQGLCHMVRARRASDDADIVVTNHALLLADAERQGRVLAPYSVVVVDEAHRLEEAATRQLGVRLRAGDLLSVTERLEAVAAPGGVVAGIAARTREASLRLFGDVKGLVAEVLGLDNPGNATLGLTDRLREDARFEVVRRAAAHAVRVFREAAAELLEARGAATLQQSLLPQPDRADDELGLAAAALGDMAAAVERVVLAPREGHVTWLELRAESGELHEAPVVVGDRIAETVLDRADTAVLTSATLTVGGSFDFMRATSGMGEGADELALPSPFDYLAQSLCVVPSDIPPYDDPAYDAALADLLADVGTRLDGRTLVLFTGYGPLRAVHALLRPRLEPRGIGVLGQGLDGTRRQVLSSFVQNRRTVLLGTSTFWEGVDVPGDALSCVVIAKLPFPVPTDPLVQARGALVADPFTRLHLPVAVLRLRQGFGRLIRRSDDRGAVVICDARIASRDYGAAFLEALPQTRVVGEPLRGTARVVEDFVRRGVAPPAPPLRPPVPGPADGETWA